MNLAFEAYCIALLLHSYTNLGLKVVNDILHSLVYGFHFLYLDCTSGHHFWPADNMSALLYIGSRLGFHLSIYTELNLYVKDK